MSEHVLPPPAVDTHAIRRRLAREYVLLTAPPVLDARAARHLIDGAVRGADNADVVIDLRAVERCDPVVVHLLATASDLLRVDGLALTLSHPSPVFDAVLASHPECHAIEVRRPRTSRPLRKSMRGEVGDV